MIKTIVADAYALVREGLCSLLREEEDIDVIGEAETCTDLRELIKNDQPDVAIIDGSLADSLDMVEELKGRIPVVIISAHDNEKRVQAAIQAGAYGFVVKDAATEELLLAVRAAEQGNTFISPRISQQIIERCFPDRFDKKEVEELTPREREVLELVTEGHTNTKMAQMLGISVKTVEKHRRRMMNKLGVDDLPSLIREAVRRKLVDIDDQI